MVSLAYILTILSVFAGVVTADEVKSDQAVATVEKWWGLNNGLAWATYLNSGFCNYGWAATLPSWLNGFRSVSAYGVFAYNPQTWWLKAVDSPSITRRSVSLKNAHMYDRRDAAHPESIVSCKNTQGQLDQLVVGDCQKAVKSLVSMKASSAHCNSCAVRLVDPRRQLAPSGVPTEALEQIANKILKACGDGPTPPGGPISPPTKSVPASPENHARRSPEETSKSNSAKSQFAMVFEKGDGKNCDI